MVTMPAQAPDRPSILAVKRGTGGAGAKSLPFDGHIDTVSLAGYVGDGVSGELWDERIYGRSSADMSADMEGGLVAVMITVLGRAGHGSCWDQGVDAIADMGVFLACFQRHCNELHRRDRNPSLDFGSAHAGKIPGGEETSTCPAHATFTVERRTLPLESDDRVQEELVALLPEAQTRIQHDFKGTIRKLLSRPPLASRDVPLVQLRRLPSHSSGHEPNTMPASSPRSIVVTGANKGIGYEAVKHLAQKLPDATIYLTARSQSNGKDAVDKMKKEAPDADFSNVRVILLEITDASSIREAVATVQKQSRTLDVLLHNSGILQVPGQKGSKGVFDVNVRGAKACIEAFAQILTKDTGKIIVVSSEVGSWSTAAQVKSLQDKLLDGSKTDWKQVEAWMDDWLLHEQGGQGVQEPWKPIDPLENSGYAVSKLFLNAYLRNYVLHSQHPRLAVVCPGYCATELNGFSGHRPASLGGESVCWPVFNDFEDGHFYQDGKDLPFLYPMPEGFNL
ncbi:hypothetical protein PaG_05502 [Moesziomyces aphidis]|uniref:Peptidase M20 dimerisation domain-containing protein n=1 Tax=Moesziomyces aphidis TaxID=84754 RepID=W3VHW9_MOEAP|nr:hypothetical protein PaG_05502 [Moesziomyces aphidis]